MRVGEAAEHAGQAVDGAASGIAGARGSQLIFPERKGMGWILPKPLPIEQLGKFIWEISPLSWIFRGEDDKREIAKADNLGWHAGKVQPPQPFHSLT